MEVRFETKASFSTNLSPSEKVAMMDEIVGRMTARDLDAWWEQTDYRLAIKEIKGLVEGETQ